MARARSLRRFAQRLGDTFALAAPMPSRVARRSARSSGIAAGGWPLSLAKLRIAERRSRLRPSERAFLPASRSRTVCRVAGAAGGGRGAGFKGMLSMDPGGPRRTRAASG